MMNGDFRISYRILNLGKLGECKSHQLSLMDITNYSLEGELEFRVNESSILLVQVPLLEAFHAFRQMLKIMPIFATKLVYAQMFREARTFLILDGDALEIDHKEINALRSASGSERIKGSYVQFCQEFGTAAKKFLGELQVSTPSLFQDERVTEKFSDLFVCLKIEGTDFSANPIV